MENILIIGAGNLATQLGFALKKSGFSIVQVYSRTQKSAKELGEKLNTAYTNKLKELDNRADLVIMAISDNAICEVSQKLSFGNKLVVHTSGSIPMQALEGISSSIGVLYPLQSFSKNEEVSFSEIPIFIENSTQTHRKWLRQIAESISDSVYQLDSAQRKQLHLAAVFVNNFVNHLFSIGEEICENNGLDFNVLQPLIEETVRKAASIGPQQAQTGPAKRNDTVVMDEHLSLLREHDLYQKIYTFVSKSIHKKHLHQ